MRWREAVREWKHHKQAATCDAYITPKWLTNQEWPPGELLSGVECSKTSRVFEYEISDLFCCCNLWKVHACARRTCDYSDKGMIDTASVSRASTKLPFERLSNGNRRWNGTTIVDMAEVQHERREHWPQSSSAVFCANIITYTGKIFSLVGGHIK